MNDINFPMDWTTTALEGAFPGLTDEFGYDNPVTTVFKNVGAPRFVFKKGELQLEFTMQVEIYIDDKWVNTVTFRDMLLDFDMKIEDFWLKVDWKKVTLAQVEIEVGCAFGIIKENTVTHIEDFAYFVFNTARTLTEEV